MLKSGSLFSRKDISSHVDWVEESFDNFVRIDLRNWSSLSSFSICNLVLLIEARVSEIISRNTSSSPVELKSYKR